MFPGSKESSRPLAERLDESEEDVESVQSAGGGGGISSKRALIWLGALAGFVITSTVSSRLGYLMALRKASLDSSCAAHTTQWSPLLRDVDVKYEFQEFDGAFMKENVYRRQGSPEVDAAWEALGVDYRAGVISLEDGLASGLDESFVQRNEKYGSGFFVNVEGMHHLHCLNLVRKSLYFNYDYYKALGEHAFKNDEPILRPHITHCLDAIRQVLMCNIDTGVLGQVWAGADDPIAFPDFKTRHKCKNYEAVKKWAEKLQGPPPESVPEDYLKPPRGEDVIPLVP